MKKVILVTLLSMASTAFAAEPLSAISVAKPCQRENTGDVGTKIISVSVEFNEGGKIISTTKVKTLDGKSISFARSKNGDGVGFYMTMIPAMCKDGKIELEFAATKSKMTSFGMARSDLRQKVVMDAGRQISIPFPFDPGEVASQSVKTDASTYTQNTLNIVATISASW